MHPDNMSCAVPWLSSSLEYQTLIDFIRLSINIFLLAFFCGWVLIGRRKQKRNIVIVYGDQYTSLTSEDFPPLPTTLPTVTTVPHQDLSYPSLPTSPHVTAVCQEINDKTLDVSQKIRQKALESATDIEDKERLNRIFDILSDTFTKAISELTKETGKGSPADVPQDP